MDGIHIIRPFERMGARVELLTPIGKSLISGRVRVNIVKDRHGQKFSITAHPSVRLCIPDVQPEQRHLLLNCVIAETGERHKYLCGHDEREWFAAAVPNRNGVSGVRTAIEALRPDEVRGEVLRRGVHPAEYASRKTAAYKRQGEWFFIPREEFKVPQHLVRRNEPLVRNDRGKPHWAEFEFRTGGDFVYFNSAHPNGLTVSEYKHEIATNTKSARALWRTGRRGAEVYVKGSIRHPDHATIHLDCWHLVRMNTESESVAMRHLAFID